MKILYVSTISNTINTFLIPHIQMLIDHGHSVDIACNVHKEISCKLTEQGCKVHNISFSRSPLSKSNYDAYRTLKKLIRDEKYELVHTHTPVASAITRFACKKIEGVKVYYTAHGFHFYKGAPLNNWLIYYPLEKWLSKFTDTLITINGEDYERAKKFSKAAKVKYIPGVGIDVGKFKNNTVDSNVKRKEIGVTGDDFLLLSVGELNKNKNHEIVIKAIAKLNNPRVRYIICGSGPLDIKLKELAAKLGVKKKVILLGYRTDVSDLYKISDLFVFPSHREGLPVSLMEAMASGLPVICSNIRGNQDLIKDESGGLLISSTNVNEISDSISRIIKDKALAERMSIHNQIAINRYSRESILEYLNDII